MGDIGKNNKMITVYTTCLVRVQLDNNNRQMSHTESITNAQSIDSF